jgi:uncharacterized membrane protein YeaQ/YmgE (transglycosylase-associated protein family)
MNIILWIVLGGVAGWLASIIMGTNSTQGPIMDIIVGIVGAVVGGWIMTLFGQAPVTGFNLYSFIVALIGAVVLIAIVRAVRRTA